MSGKALKVGLPLAGLALGGFLIWGLGPGEVWAELKGGWWPGFVLVVGTYVVQQALGSFAFWLLGTRRSGPGWKNTPFWRLTRVRYLGEVLNYSMPTGGLGGEPFKHLVLSRAEGSHASFQAVASAKFLHVAGVGPFAAVVFFAAWSAGTGGAVWGPYLITLALVSIAITAGVWALLMLRFVGNVLMGGFYRIRHRVPWWLRRGRKLLHGDRTVSAHIRRAVPRALVAYACYIAMWWMAALEWAAIALVLGAGDNVGLIGGGVFECATILVNASVPVPAGVGTQEAGRTVVAGALGMALSTGVAMSLVRRAREMLMVGFAMVLGLLRWGGK